MRQTEHEQLRFKGIVLRDEGIEQVSENASTFMADAMDVIRSLRPGEYSGEDLRLLVQDHGVKPHHHNAWGAMVMNAIRQKLIEDTGRMRKAQMPQGHARKMSIYQKK